MFQRITKKDARQLFDKGETIVFCPCKLRPGFPWSPQVSLSNAEGMTFDRWLAEWKHWNASHECGYYPHFYLERHTGTPVDA